MMPDPMHFILHFFRDFIPKNAPADTRIRYPKIPSHLGSSHDMMQYFGASNLAKLGKVIE